MSLADSTPDLRVGRFAQGTSDSRVPPEPQVGDPRDDPHPRRIAALGLRPWHGALFVVACFSISRWVVFARGVRSFYELPQMQALDHLALSGDLFRSLLYLHEQPPLFNALLALLLRAGVDRFALAASLCFWTFGLALTLLLYGLLLRLEVAVAPAALATALFAVGPACLLYETMNLYTYPTAVLLLAAAYALHRYCSGGWWGDAAAYAALITGVAWMRSVYHLAWVAAALLLLALARRPCRKAIAALAASFALVAGLYLKNWLFFGFLGTSSLLGLNLYRISTELLPPEERLTLVERGELSPFALYGVNRPITAYPVLPRPLPAIDLSAPTARALLPWGWAAKVEGPPEERFLWNDGPWSVLVLPRGLHGPLTLTVRGEPFHFAFAPAQSVLVALNGRRLGTWQLGTAPETHAVSIPAGSLRDDGNVVTLRYAYALSPRSLGISRDPRELAVRWLGFAFDPPLPASPGSTAPLGETLPEDVIALQSAIRADGGPNLNHALYPEVERQYVRDALQVIRLHPGLYLEAVSRAALIFLAPPMEHPAFRVKRPLIADWDRLYTVLFYGASLRDWPRAHSQRSRWLPTAMLVGSVSWLSLALALLALPATAARCLRAPRAPRHVVLLFCVFNVLYVFAVTSLLEYGENNRFRMEVEPLFWVVVVAWGATVVASLRSRAAARRASRPAHRLRSRHGRSWDLPHSSSVCLSAGSLMHRAGMHYLAPRRQVSARRGSL